jgi:hypothetical protein
MKHSRMLILILLLVTFVVPTFAQSNTQWFVYFFDNVNNEIVRVYDTGDMEVYTLGLTEGELANSVDMVISPDGSLLALCKLIMGEGMISGRTLVVRDIAANTNLFEMPVDAGIDGCRPSAFNADGSQFVLGLTALLNFDPSTGQALESETPLWRIQIIDTQTGDVLDEFNSDNPSAPVLDEFGRGTPVPLMADVISFENDTLIFRGIPYVGMGIPGELPAWSWNLSSDTIESAPNFGRVSSDYLPQTGELVFPALDESLPAAQPGGPLSQANVVNLQLSDGTIQTLYHDDDEVIVGVRFVNDGQAIGVSLLEGFDMNNPSDTFPIRHILIDRSGTITEIGAAYEQFTQLAAVPGGAVITWSEWLDGAEPVSHLGIVENGTLRDIWQYTPDTSRGYSFLEIIWSPAIVVSGTLQPFTSADF